MKKGYFIVLEGGEGSGKSTQCHLIKEYLSGKGYEVILTREPGGTPTGEKIRKLLKDPDIKKTPLSELMLFNASRDCHIEEKILPAKKSGAIVICDRFSDSTLAYQSGGRKIPYKLVCKVNNLVIRRCLPDLEIIILRDIAIGLNDAKRVSGRVDHFEKEKIDFHKRVQDIYTKIAKDRSFPRVLIDGNKTVAEVFEIIKPIIDKLILNKS